MSSVYAIGADVKAVARSEGGRRCIIEGKTKEEHKKGSLGDQGFAPRFQLDGGGGVLPLPFCCCCISVAIGRSEGSGPVFTLGRGWRISGEFVEEGSIRESLEDEGPFCW
jgi:hypothetical protein